MTDTYSEQNTSQPAPTRSTPQPQPASDFAEGWTPAVSQPPRLHNLMAPEQNVQRIMWTGTIWFTAAVGSIALVLGLLLSSGWRPYDLPLGAEVLWWFGSALTTLSVGLIGWSGCPILEVSVPVADKNKSRTMQFGTAFFIAGGAISLFAVLLGPVS